MNATIGGMFALQLESNRSGNGLSILNQPSIRMVNASSAIWLLADQLEPRRVWLPSYLCQSMISAINRNKSEINFYPSDPNGFFGNGLYVATNKPDTLRWDYP